jgi:hypothetical protein
MMKRRRKFTAGQWDIIALEIARADCNLAAAANALKTKYESFAGIDEATLRELLRKTAFRDPVAQKKSLAALNDNSAQLPITHLWISNKQVEAVGPNGNLYAFWETPLRPVNVWFDGGSLPTAYHVTTRERETFMFESLPRDIVPLDKADEHPLIVAHRLSAN